MCVEKMDKGKGVGPKNEVMCGHWVERGRQNRENMEGGSLVGGVIEAPPCQSCF